MKRLAIALIFVCLNAAVLSARAAEAKADPSQYTLVMHVSASRYGELIVVGAIVPNPAREVLTATVGNRHYQLLGDASAKALTNSGDYHARLTKDEHKTSFESLQEFEILFPDGTTRSFQVTAQSE
jgi:hypothetical protein